MNIKITNLLIDIRWFFKKIIYKIKMCKKIWKHLIYSWDYLPAFENIYFELFCDFYRKGRFEIFDWKYDKEHKKIRKLFDTLYIWYTIDKPAKEKQLDELQTQYFRDHPITFTELSEKDEDGQPLYEMTIKDKKGKDKKFDKIMKLEDEIKNTHDMYLKKLIEIKDYLWS